MDSAEAVSLNNIPGLNNTPGLNDNIPDDSFFNDGAAAANRPPLAAFTGWHRTRAGIVALDAVPEHRIRIHAAGGPIRGFCGRAPFVYTRGDMDLMPAGYADSWREDDDNTSLYLSVTPQLLRRTALDIDLDPDRVQLDLRHQFRDSHIEHIALALDAERRSGFANGDLYTESLSTALAVHLLRRYPTEPSARAAGMPPLRLKRLQEYIEQNLDQSLSLDELAAVAGISSSHLKTLFRRSTGVPVHQYVIQRRVQRAHDLLVQGDMPISEVAFEAGFAHQSHMARHMRRLLGVAPAALRKGGR
jgi:AraC family transcriptional regulator